MAGPGLASTCGILATARLIGRAIIGFGRQTRADPASASRPGCLSMAPGGPESTVGAGNLPITSSMSTGSTVTEPMTWTFAENR